MRLSPCRLHPQGLVSSPIPSHREEGIVRKLARLRSVVVGTGIAIAIGMQLSPYRTPSVVLPRKLASCSDDNLCRCNLARPRLLFAHRAWRWVWLGIAGFAGSAGASILLACIIPVGISVNGPTSRSSFTHGSPVLIAAKAPEVASMFAGSSHAPSVLLAQAKAARNAGLDVTVLESDVSLKNDVGDQIDLRPTDQVVSVNGYLAGVGRAFKVDQPGPDIVIELLRAGRRVVLGIRRG